jgi:cytochrome c biogenesis protein CcmG/thiol:disulfide interchange protein DsbE
MGEPSKLPSALIGKSVPEFDGLTDENKSVPGFDTAALARGDVSVVNFWASWCIPCQQEHAMLMRLKQRTGVSIYGINYKDQTAAARRFLGLHGNPFRAVGVDGNGRTAIEWGVYGMPETFIVDGKGRIAYKHVGPITVEVLAETIIPAIRAAQGHDE